MMDLVVEIGNASVKTGLCNDPNITIDQGKMLVNDMAQTIVDQQGEIYRLQQKLLNLMLD